MARRYQIIHPETAEPISEVMELAAFRVVPWAQEIASREGLSSYAIAVVNVDEPKPSDPDEHWLNNASKKALQLHADRMGIDYAKSWSKAKMIEAITNDPAWVAATS